MKIKYSPKGGEQTFMDETLKCLFKNGIAGKSMKTLVHLLVEEEYDTDAMKGDVHYSEGNILNCVRSQRCVDLVKKFIANVECM